MSMQFNFSLAQTVHFGMDSTKNLPQILGQENITNVLIVTDESLCKLGFVKKITDILEEGKVNYEVFSEVEPNPSIATVNKGAEVFKSKDFGAIIAFGGGSPMDTAKAIAVLATFGGKITDYEGAEKVPGPVLPIIAIPTTAGTGAEVTASSVITDPDRNFKFSIVSANTIPKFALLDPSYITGLPPHIAAATGVDAIVHAVEAYLSKIANPFTDAMAEKAMTLLGSNIHAFVEDRKNGEAASNMLIGSNFAGIAFARAKLGNVHAMAHPVGAHFHVAHGVACAVMLPYVIAYNASVADVKKYEKIYTCLTGKTCENFKAEMLTEAMHELNKSLGIPKNLTELGVTEDKIQVLAEDSMMSGNVLVNPRSTTLEEMIELFKTAM